MEFIDIPTEQTTAVTDAMIALLAMGFIPYLFRIGRQHNLGKVKIWSWLFGLLALSSALGAVAHGVKMYPEINRIIWQPINLSLGLTVALFVVAVLYDLRGHKKAREILPILLIIGTVFYIVTLIIPGRFIVFILYEVIAMTFALGAYFWLAIRRRLKGAWLMTVGVLITIVASGVQASGAIYFTLIWEFNFNGIFHLIQMVGLMVLLFGLRASLLSKTD